MIRGDDSMLDIQNMTKIYGRNKNSQVKALNGINLTVVPGEMIALVGTSGSGKSTLLNILGLLDIQTSGEYFIDGVSIKSISEKQKAELRNKKFGFIMQDFALIEKYTVKQNLEIPYYYSKNRISKKEREKRIDLLLDTFGLLNKKNAYTNNLSGGQRQRVAIARALFNNPDIILADEPTGALDTKNKTEIIKTLKRLNENGKTIIIVTHDRKVALSCEKIYKMEDGRFV